MASAPSRWQDPAVQARLRRRKAAERGFRALGAIAVLFAAAALSTLLVSVLWNGPRSAYRTEIALDVRLDAETLGVDAAAFDTASESFATADFGAAVRGALLERFPGVSERAAVRELVELASRGAPAALSDRLREQPELFGRRTRLWLVTSDEVNAFAAARESGARAAPATRLTERQIAWIEALDADGRLARRFSTHFFRAGDSREPELAGIGGALVGSALTLLVALAVSFPLGVAAAIYLEEFARDNRFTRQLEVNINNLAAVPSIVFGLLGLAIFLRFLGMPRSAPVVGGLTLALMTLPVIIIASRAAIAAVPVWIRESARGLGASPIQVVAHQVLPLAMPGIVTGTLLGLARAMGETAPLLMIGMVAFIVDVPTGFGDAASALPVQIFLWADSPERGFVDRVSGAILVLLILLGLINGAAILLRQRFEQRW